MVKAYFLGSGELIISQDVRLTRKLFHALVDNCLFWAMNNDTKDEVAEITCGSAKYIVRCETWMEISRVFGKMDLYKDTMNSVPLFTKRYILAD